MIRIKQKNPYREIESIQYKYGYLSGLNLYLTQFKYSKAKDLVNRINNMINNLDDDWMIGYHNGAKKAADYYAKFGLKKTLLSAKDVSRQLNNFKKENNLK